MSIITHIQFCPSDWLSGTRGLSAAETGVYITLIALMYERCEPLNDDMKKLSRVCGCSNSAFVKILNSLLNDGKIYHTDNGLFNARVEKEIQNIFKKSEVARTNINQRWEKRSTKSMPVLYGRNTIDDTNDILTNNHKPVIEDISNDISFVQPIANAQAAPEKPKKLKTNAFFEKFKNAYPKRDSQIPWQPALKKFEALVKSGEPPDKIIEGAARYCAEQQRLGNFGTKFVRLPVVFLNQSQWKEYSQVENLLNFNDGLKTALSPPFGHKQQPLRGIALIQHNRMIKENEQLKQAN